MFIMKLLKSIHNGNKLDLFNKGNHFRDFTYIDDVTEMILRLIKRRLR